MQSARPLHHGDFKPQPVSTIESGDGRLLAVVWTKIRACAASMARAFSIDLRSLAVFRIALGMLLLWDLTIALSNVKAFYSDEGVLPREVLFTTSLWSSDSWWSLNMISGSPWVQGAIFLAGAFLAIMLLVGWRTRLATLASWVLICSMQSRNPAILHGGDDMMRVMLFWAFFLPLGARWSVDARLTRNHESLQDALVTLPGACLLLQLAIVYLFSMILKTDPMWHAGGVGLRVALQMDHFVKPFGMWLREHDSWCRTLTTLTVYLEMWGAWLAFVPVRNALFRLVAVALFWGFHAGIWLCMDVGPFCFIMAAAWLPFLPGVVWDRLGKIMAGVLARLPRARPVLLRFCARVMLLVRRKLEPFFHWRSTVAYGLRPSWLAQFITLCCFGYVLCWNVRDTNYAKFEPWFPASTNWLGHALRWEQYWGMFAPKPVLDDGWFVCVAKQADGQEVDLLRRGKAVDWGKPHVVSEVFWDSRWQKYMANLWTSKFKNCRLPMLRYLTQEWNASHDALSQVSDVKLWYVIEMTREDGSVEEKTRPTELAHFVAP